MLAISGKIRWWLTGLIAGLTAGLMIKLAIAETANYGKEHGVNLPSLPIPETNRHLPQAKAASAQPTAPSSKLSGIPSANLAKLPPIAQINVDNNSVQTAPNSNNSQNNNINSMVPNSLYPVDSVNDPAFLKMLKQKFPLSPNQIEALRHVLDKQYRAIRTPVKVPKPVLTSRWVNLDPGSVPPVVRLSTGYVTSLVFVDETGAAWPIRSYDIGNPKAFNVQWDKNNILMIQSLSDYQSGNMIVQLSGLPTPVAITIVSDQQQVDYRLDLRIPGRGPHPNGEIIGQAISGQPSTVLANLLDGLAPKDAQPLTVEGGNARAWLDGQDKLLLRTKLTVLSPGWSQYMRSADGMQVYQMSKTPLILASDNGKTIKLSIKGY